MTSDSFLPTRDFLPPNDMLIPFFSILPRSFGTVGGQVCADEPEANAVQFSLFKDAEDDSRRRKEVFWPTPGVVWSAAGDYYRHCGKRFQF